MSETPRQEESKADRAELTEDELAKVSGGDGTTTTTTIGSATGGAGAGKVKFNEFQITKTTDGSSPL